VDGKTFSTESTEDIDHNLEVEESLTPKVRKEIPDANVVMTLGSSSSLHFG
jgi:ribosomal protein S25